MSQLIIRTIKAEEETAPHPCLPNMLI